MKSYPNENTPDTSTTLLQVEALSDLFAEITDLDSGLQKALKFILECVGRESGVILVQSAHESMPAAIITQRLNLRWTAQIDDPESELRLLASEGLQSGKSPAPNPALGLAGAVLLSSPTDLQGILLIGGKTLSPEALSGLERLGRVVGRGIQMEWNPLGNADYGRGLATLQMLAADLNPDLSQDELILRVIPRICRILRADAGSLVLLEDEEEKLAVKKTFVCSSEWVQQASLKVDEGILAACLQSGEPQLVQDVRQDARFNFSVDSIADFGTRAILCVPLILADKIRGAIAVLSEEERAFNSYDKKLLGAIASVMTHAMHLQDLVDRLQVANAELEVFQWQLIHSRNTLRALFDNIPISFYIIDKQFNLLAVNMSRANRTSLDPQKLVGGRCFKTLYNLDDVCPGCQVSQTLFGGATTHRTERQWQAEDEPLEWEIFSYPVYDAAGKTVQAILLEQDVTEKRRLESRLIQSEKLAAVGQLAAGIAHEINNPLTAVVANAQLLQRDSALDLDVRDAVDLIALAGDRAVQVVRNLLDLSRREQYNFEPLDLNETILKALSLLQHELISNSVEMTFDAGEDLPLILVNQEHLQSVWINLISNAVDAMGEKADKRIRIVSCQKDGQVEVIISDNGNGIPPENLPRIFEPFYTTKTPGNGTGLGLAISHRVIERHGGHIMVDSQSGKGTTFTISLPIS